MKYSLVKYDKNQETHRGIRGDFVFKNKPSCNGFMEMIFENSDFVWQIQQNDDGCITVLQIGEFYNVIGQRSENALLADRYKQIKEALE
jgi:hypothetical protein